MKLLNIAFLLTITFAFTAQAENHDNQFDKEIRPFLKKYCIECHGGKKVKGHVNFNSIDTLGQAFKKYEVWEEALELMHDKEMPPEDEKQPTSEEVQMVKKWYTDTFLNITAKPGNARLQRMSTLEYRNSLKSLLGFDLELSFTGTDETVQESSLVIKMMPPDPPGESGFGNDTVRNPLTETLWEKYNFIANSAVDNLFSAKYRQSLEAYTGPIKEKLSESNVKKLISKFTTRAFKTTDCKDVIASSYSRISAVMKASGNVEVAVKKELKTILLSPQFLYKGNYDKNKKGEQPVNGFELAQRLSYFIWGTMPDDELLQLASNGRLNSQSEILKQTERMLNDERSKVFTETFAREWLALDEIKKSKDRYPKVDALYKQPLAFVDYLIRENRPLIEAVDSKVTFVNNYVLGFYDKKDTSKVPRSRGQKGIEMAIQPVHKMELTHTQNRGGLISMPGILGMYSGNRRTSPILRGIWVLERILGDELAEPPMDVPPIPKPKKGEKLTFRQIFERHQSSKSCSICHQKIDPLGFGLENFDATGKYRKSGKDVDSSGQTPDGEKFKDYTELKKILTTKYKKQIIHTITEKLFSYGLARKLEAYDRPTVNEVAEKLAKENGTYQDLIKALVTSLPFTHTVVQ